ncbi:DUF1800 domain-containing protein [Luteolibacter pohnpeiensis]|uniref:DUF1800 domain-containing protein n=1 Tax=Luteolibacter pohnpeiensis TaxID=454153 RepID=A0A934S5Q1_9BACT|nr:DUF1800 domain-containing protein [Luteolibacter pohnpeiensis]MBK1883076.1 DUF1800 domain-containing protein [Luteolibacter pohnpeiensis]
MFPKANDSWTIFEAAHLLNRAGFGGDPEQIKRIHQLGRSAAVEWLLDPEENIEAFPLPPWCAPDAVAERMKEQAAAISAVRMNSGDQSAEKVDMKLRDTRREFQKESREQGIEARAWWFRRMLLTKAPLREKMTLFWHDHFPSSDQKVKEPALLMRQNQLFREHALGNFKALTHAVTDDPAMMLYLDAQNSKKDQPNENYARELMELFTLGVGHYTEDDVHDAARAFTGRRLNRETGEVVQLRRQWDAGRKTLFGKSGKYDASQVVDLIFQQGQTARFMVNKLWEYFAYDNPSTDLTDWLAHQFRDSDYEIKPLLRQMFLSEEFYGEASMRTQIKCPVQFLVQLMKQLEIHRPPAGVPLDGQRELGQILFTPPNVAGWDWGKAWINTNTLLARYNLAGVLTKSTQQNKRMTRDWPGPDFKEIAPMNTRKDPQALVDSLVFRFFQGTVPDKARISFIEYATSKAEGKFTDTEIGELCHLMLSTPYYQLT